MTTRQRIPFRELIYSRAELWLMALNHNMWLDTKPGRHRK